MTDCIAAGQAAAEAQQARVEALRQRRNLRADGTGSPASSARPVSRRRRRHVAKRSRVGVAAFSVATMLGLIGVMGLGRPSSSATPIAPADKTAAVLAGAPSAPAPTATGAGSIEPPPIAATPRPSVQVTTPTAAAPVARTHGSR